MQDGHYHLKGRTVLLLVHVHWDSAPVVLYGYGVVFIDSYLYVCAISCQCFVYGVVYDLIHEVVESFLSDVSDVHGRTLPYCLQSLQYLDVTGGVTCVNLSIFVHC